MSPVRANPVRKRWVAVLASTPTWFEEAEDRLTSSPTQSNQNDEAELVRCVQHLRLGLTSKWVKVGSGGVGPFHVQLDEPREHGGSRH